MAQVTFPDHFRSAIGDVRETHIDAANYRDLVIKLKENWPQLAPLLERTAVAIDGQIYQDAFIEPLNPESEVFFMPRIEGG